MRPPPIAAVLQVAPASGVSESVIAALVFASESDLSAGRARLDEMFQAGLKEGRFLSEPTFAQHGSVLLVGMTGADRVDALERRAQGDLRRLRTSLEMYRVEAGRFPTTQEGLAALLTDVPLIDDFAGALPNDPWGHAYHYASPHPTKPGDVDLRSAGADGEIDTEDDVFP